MNQKIRELQEEINRQANINNRQDATLVNFNNRITALESTSSTCTNIFFEAIINPNAIVSNISRVNVCKNGEGLKIVGNVPTGVTLTISHIRDGVTLETTTIEGPFPVNTTITFNNTLIGDYFGINITGQNGTSIVNLLRFSRN